MLYESSPVATLLCAAIVLVVAGIAFLATRSSVLIRTSQKQSGENTKPFRWLWEAVSIPGRLLSVPVLMGIIGLIALYGYLGIICLIAYIAGIVIRIVLPLDQLNHHNGHTFNEIAGSKPDSRWIHRAVGLSSIVVCFFFLLAEFVAIEAVLKPLLGDNAFAGSIFFLIASVVALGLNFQCDLPILQAVRSFLFLGLCFLLTYQILERGHMNWENRMDLKETDFATIHPESFSSESREKWHIESSDIYRMGEDFKKGLAFEIRGDRENIADLPKSVPTDVPDGREYYRWYRREKGLGWALSFGGGRSPQIGEIHSGLCQTKEVIDGTTFANGFPQVLEKNDLRPVGEIRQLTAPSRPSGLRGPIEYLEDLMSNWVIVWRQTKVRNDGRWMDVYFPALFQAREIIGPAANIGMLGIRRDFIASSVDLCSFMCAFFFVGFSTSASPYRKWTSIRSGVSTASIGVILLALVSICVLFIGIAAMTSLILDPANSNTAAPLLAKSFGSNVFGIVSAFLVVLLFSEVISTFNVIFSISKREPRIAGFCGRRVDFRSSVSIFAASAVAAAAIFIGKLMETVPLATLVNWAVGICLSAFLPSGLMLKYWKGITKQGVVASIVIGTGSFVCLWLFCDVICEYLYGFPVDTRRSWIYERQSFFIPLNYPQIISVPLGFLALLSVSFLGTRNAGVDSGNLTVGNRSIGLGDWG